MTLFIAETNDRIRQRLASIAAGVEGITVVGEAGDVKDAVGGINRAKPDSVIVALPMSGGSALEVLSAAKSSNPASTAIMLSVGPCSECEHKCFALGADYFFEKSGEMKKIVTTLVLLAHHTNRQESLQVEDSAEIFHNPISLASEGPGLDLKSLTPVACPRLHDVPAAKNTYCFLLGAASRNASSSLPSVS
jgi:DNA-binding NarL/FixJ family response regulator